MAGKIKSPIDLFFKMGEKATGGDPEKQADFIYYMVWILFIAFGTMFCSNLYRLIVYRDIDYVVWTLVGFAISVIQYFSLKGMYDMKQMKKRPLKADKSLESVDDMMKTFNQDVKREVKRNMFGKKVESIEGDVAPEKPMENATPDLVVEKEQPETVGMPGFTKDAEVEPEKVEEVIKAEEAKATVKPKEQYQIIETSVSPADGLFVYKIVTNKYLGELGGVYDAD